MRHYINGVEISPRNRESIGLVSDFTGNPDELKLTTDSIILPREGLTVVKNHIQSIGLFEGIPYQIQLDGGITIEYYIDLLDNLVINDIEAEVKIKQRRNKDNFKDRAEGTSFELMLTKGVIFPIFDVPYLVVKENITELAFTTAVSIFLLSKTLAEEIRDLQDAIAEIQTAIGTDTSDATAGIIRAIARAVYIATMLYIVITLSIKLIALIFPPLRNLKGIKVRELLVTACTYFGFTFESTLLDDMSNLTLLPVPLKKDRPSIFEFIPAELIASSFNKGVPSGSDSTPTVWLLLEALEVMFNARTKIYNNVVQFERRDYWENITSANISPALVIQKERIDEYSYNTGDVWKRYYISYLKDYSDFHTLDKIYNFNDAEFSTEPTNIVNEDLVSIKNLNEVQIPFALGSRKEKLNYVENTVLELFTIIDTLVGDFGGASSLSATVDARIGALQIGAEYFGQTKILYTLDGKQTTNYLDYLGASSLWANYHYINQITLNSYQIRTSTRIRINSEDFVNLLDNNFAEINGVICEILRIEWLDEKSYSKITYRMRNDYATGKVYNLVVNG